MINSDQAYKLEKYRFLIYLPILLVGTFYAWMVWAYFPYSVDLRSHIIVGLIFIISVLLCFYFREKSRWVTFYALMAMEEWRHKSYERYLAHNLISSLTDKPYLVFIAAIVGGGAYYTVRTLGLFELQEDWGLLWQIHASVLGLVFVTLSFLIGLLNELNKKVATGKKLAQRVHFKGLTILNTFLDLVIGCVAFAKYPHIIAETIAIGAFTFLIASIIYLFKEFIGYLLEQDLLKGLFLSTLKAELRESLSKEILGKMAHQFFENVGKKLGFEVGYDKQDRHSREVMHTKFGLVTDVDLISLRKLARKIHTPFPVRDHKSGTDTSYKAVLLKNFTFFSAVTRKHDAIALVAKEETHKSIDKITQKVYAISGFDREEDIEASLKQLADLAAEYIESSPFRAMEIIDYMGSLIDETLDVLKEYQIEFNYEKSKQASTLDWRSISQLVHRLDDIFKEIMRKKNPELISRVISFLDSRIDSAIERENHFLFKEFAGSYARIYYLSLKNLDDTERRLVIDKIHREIQSLFQYRFDFDADTPVSKTTEFISGAAIELQNIVKELNKIAIDEKDSRGVETFHKTLQTVSDIFRQDYDNTQHLVWQKEDLERQEQTAEIKGKVERLEQLIKLNETLERRGTLMNFALGAWLVELYRQNRIDAEFLTKAIHPYQQKFTNHKELARAYFDINRHYRHDDLGIGFWESTFYEEGVVHSIRMDWLAHFYVINALRLVPANITEGDFIYAEDMHEYSSSYLETILQDVKKIIEVFEQNKSFWRPLLPIKTRTVATGVEEFDDTEKKGSLIALHEAGIEKRKQEEADLLANAPIDPDKWNEFKTEFKKEYEKTSVAKQLIKKLGTYIDQTDQQTDDEEAFGVKTLDFKYHFIKKWYISTHGVPEHFAEGLASGENKKVFAAIVNESVKETALTPEEEGSPARIDSMIQSLRDAGYEPNIIFLDNWNMERQLWENPDFVRVMHTEQHLPGYQGTYKGLEVYRLHTEELRNQLCVVDLKAFAKFTQKQVRGQATEIYLNVRLITNEEIDKWIGEEANIVKKNDVLMTREEAQKHMAERVALDILENFEFEITNKNAARSAALTDRY